MDGADLSQTIFGCITVKTIGYLFTVSTIIWTLVFLYVLYFGNGWEQARFVLMAVLMGLHQIEEYVVCALFLGEDFLFLNWGYRSGMFVSLKGSFATNLVGPAIFISLCSLVMYSTSYATIFLVIQLWAMGLQAHNNGFHFGAWHLMGQFSPGQVTGCLVYVPYYAWFNYVMWAEYDVPVWVLYIIWIIAWFEHWYTVTQQVSIRSPNHWAVLLEKAGGEQRNPIYVYESEPHTPCSP